LRAKVSVVVNLEFNVNIEILSLVQMKLPHDTLSTLRNVLSTIDASNHIHHMELRVDPLDSFNMPVGWTAWEEVYSILAGPHFQFLRVLYINIGPCRSPWSNVHDVVEKAKDMAAGHPLLTTRGIRVSYCGLTCYQCIFCLGNPWDDCPRI
jgi:hypothetical protein